MIQRRRQQVAVELDSGEGTDTRAALYTAGICKRRVP
jgi:hypothetical protein